MDYNLSDGSFMRSTLQRHMAELSQFRDQLATRFSKRTISKASIEQALQYWQAAVRLLIEYPEISSEETENVLEMGKSIVIIIRSLTSYCKNERSTCGTFQRVVEGEKRRRKRSLSESKLQDSSSPSLSSTARPSEANAPKRHRTAYHPRSATKVLKEWFLRHIEHAYPSALEKEYLSAATGLTGDQLNSWFTNARRRSNNGEKFRSDVVRSDIEEVLQEAQEYRNAAPRRDL